VKTRWLAEIAAMPHDEVLLQFYGPKKYWQIVVDHLGEARVPLTGSSWRSHDSVAQFNGIGLTPLAAPTASGDTSALPGQCPL